MIRYSTRHVLDTFRLVAQLDIVGPQGLDYGGRGYTLFGRTSPDRVLAVSDDEALPCVIRLDFAPRAAQPVILVEVTDADQLDPKYASTVGELVQRLAVQADQTQHGFEAALNGWLDTGLLVVSRRTVESLHELYYISVPLPVHKPGLVQRLFRASREPNLVDSSALRALLLDAIEQIVRHKHELVEHAVESARS